MKTTLQCVREFHQAYARTEDPKVLQHGIPEEVIELREKLITEELKELLEAIRMGDRAKILQEISDLQYVVDGTYLALGIDDELKTAAFMEVHRANMSKRQPDGSVLRREDGKVLKGENYRPPDMRNILAKLDCGAH